MGQGLYIFFFLRSPVFKRMAFELSLMLKKAFTDSSFYFILLMELVWWAIYFKRHFISKRNFVAVCLCLLKTEIKQEKWLLRCAFFFFFCDSLYFKCLPRQRSQQPSHEDLLVRSPKRVKTIDSTMRLHRAGTLSQDIAFYLSYFLLLVSLLF